MTFTFPQYLVETEWLETHLDDPDLRVLDCTVSVRPDASGTLGNGGREAWTRSHIPGSGFIDLMHELSDPNGPWPFTMPEAAQFAEVMSRCGVEAGKRLILYDTCSDKWAHIWAARVWWMLRAYGFEAAAVLNGGWHKWTLEKRPVSTGAFSPPPAHFVPRMRPELLADKHEVLAAIGNRQTCLVNALTAEEHAGTKARYGRAGHIPSSVNVPTAALVDPLTHAYLPVKQLRAQFETVGALSRERVITYCGGGIAASSDAFVLTLLGAPNVAVYDGSLFEWASDPSLPMETSE